MSRLMKTICKRCNKPITTLINPIFSSRETQAKFSRICERCITPAEQIQLLRETGENISNQGLRD
jgi:RNase P subunit RPR2